MFTQCVISEGELYVVIRVLQIQIEIHVTPMSLIPSLIRPNNRLEKNLLILQKSHNLNTDLQF